MARKTKAEKRLARLQSENKNLRNARGARGKGRHRRRGGSSPAGVSGKLRAAANPKSLMLAVVGAIGARALYGYLSEKMPEQSDGLRAGLATAALPVAAAVGRLGLDIVGPLAAGAVAVAALDKIGGAVSEALAQYSPGAASAILAGMGGGAAAGALYNTPPLPAVTPAPTPTPAMLAAAGDTAPQPAGDNPDADSAAAGLGSIAMIQLRRDRISHTSPY